MFFHLVHVLRIHSEEESLKKVMVENFRYFDMQKLLAHQMGFGKNLDAEGTCNGKKQNSKYKFQKKQTGYIIVTLIFHMNSIPFP